MSTQTGDEAATGRMLLAEELCVLISRLPEGASISETWVVGALVGELLVDGRLAPATAEHGGKVVTVINAGSTGDDLLDETLSLLGGVPSGAARAAADVRWRPARMNGRRIRRRLREGGELRAHDLAYWWYGSWRCAEFPELPSTLVVQLLRLQESLDRPVLRVLERLKARGAVTDEREFDPLVARKVRQRVREAALTPPGPIDPRVAHLVALRSRNSAWLQEDIGSDRAELMHAESRALTFLYDLPVAQAVGTLTDAHRKWQSWYDE